MDEACNEKAEATIKAWKELRSQAQEVERWLGSLQRSTSSSQIFWQQVGNLQKAYDAANAAHTKAAALTIQLANTCFE